MNKSNDSSTAVPRQQNVVLITPHGELHLSLGAAHDHANMRANELHAFLTLVHGEARENFSNLNDNLQSSLLWMLSQAACELDQLLSQVTIAEQGAPK
jgi:hypothetical protein